MEPLERASAIIKSAAQSVRLRVTLMMFLHGFSGWRWARSGRRVVLAVVSAALTLAAVEGVLQLAVITGIPARLADPEAYAHPLCDAWFWRAHARQQPPTEGNARHDTLGWIPVGDDRVGDGVGYPEPRTGGSPLVLVGDSFLAGTTEREDRIGSMLQAGLVVRGIHAQVEDHAVGGYGLDQILLRLQARAASLEPGTPVVIGILTTDLDRTILWEREAPKPRFVLDSRGDLVLKTNHLAGPMPSAAPRLLTWARLMQYRAGRVAAAAGLPHAECRVEEKQALAKALLESITTTCTQSGLRCLVVPFLRADDLERLPSWRENLIESETSALPRLALRSILSDLEAPLFGPDRHPSTHQNRRVADAILAWLEGPARAAEAQP